jgi:hypothetical protein
MTTPNRAADHASNTQYRLGVSKKTEKLKKPEKNN